MKDNIYRSKHLISNFRDFTAYFGLVHLRPYQVQAAQAVIDSVRNGDGASFVWKFARQGGKDETLAALYQYLMLIYSHRDITIVAAAPTFKPQTEIAMRRLADRLGQNIVLKMEWSSRLGYTYQLRRARTIFLSADPAANVVGATAWPLLVINEAQDVRPDLYDRRFAPMAAAHNATRLFSGTAWTRNTLLAREEAACRLSERLDGRPRVFVVDGFEIGRIHQPYARFLSSELERLGQDHPIFRTQYLCREIDAEAGMFTPARRALMACDAGRLPAAPASPGDMSHVDDAAAGPDTSPSSTGAGSRKENMRRASYPPAYSLSENTPLPFRGGVGGGVMAHVFTLDVAGQDEATFHNPDEQLLRNPGRDAVTLTIASVDLSAIRTLQAPIFRILQRHQWTGLNHLSVLGKVTALADQWRPQHIIIDATGVGEGLWAMLDKHYPTRVMPVKFSAQKKSELGYRFLAMIETGRLRDCMGRGDLHGRPHGDPAGAQHVVPDHSLHVVATRQSPSPLSSSVTPSMIDRQHPSHVVARSPEGATKQSPSPLSSSVTPSMVDRQYAACVSEVLLGPQKLMRWGVPEGTRDENGELIHDDILMADALLAEADQLEWRVSSPTLIIYPKDPLDEMSHFR